MTLVSRLQELLNAARIDDDEIRSGIKLSDTGIAKLASRTGASSEEVKSALQELISNLRDEHNRDVTDTSVYDGVVYESQQRDRYTYETDFLGNLTVRDTVTGDEHYVGGSESAHIVRQLELTHPGSHEEQDILRWACEDHPRYALAEDDNDGDTGDLIAEIKNDAGSYNFPWRVGDKYGTGTAAYTATAKEFKLKLVSIRDDRGEEIAASPELKDAINKEARDFIGRE